MQWLPSRSLPPAGIPPCSRGSSFAMDEFLAMAFDGFDYPGLGHIPVPARLMQRKSLLHEDLIV